MNVCCYSIYKDRYLAIMESPTRIKIFQKKGETYDWKETVWLKRSPLFQVPQCAEFADGKWFIAGHECLNEDCTKISWLKVADDKGSILKNDIIVFKYSKAEALKRKFFEMRRYFVRYKNSFFYFIENKLKVYVISIKNLKVEKIVDFNPPYFYKKMPDDFYIQKDYRNPLLEMKRDLDKWQVSYSRITRALVEGDKLILQIRTCRKDLKKFALLIYNADTFKAEKTFFIDDLLLGSKDGKLYFFANGDPGLDDEVTKTVINIYSLK